MRLLTLQWIPAVAMEPASIARLVSVVLGPKGHLTVGLVVLIEVALASFS